ncbi:MAG: 3-deoxy-D-manno-octulosonic acid transferase [Magnetococcales bacterium]|nr:3-deoxy-D-manno-octulosonic acid transferase [Magnetococcales bacterium]
MPYLVYSFLLGLLILLTLPFWAWRYFTTLKYKGTVLQRFGWDLPTFFSQNDKPRIWLHAVSVGETLAAKGVVEQLLNRFPDHEIVLSTVTKTGQQVALEKLSGVGAVFYLPIDLPWIVNRVINQVRPRFFVVMETELWPNLFHAMQKRDIPVMTINGRLSPNSFKNYYRFRFFMRTFLEPVRLFAMQSTMDAQRMAQIGGLRDIIHHTGNLKYDQALQLPTPFDMELLAHKIPVPEDPVWIAASTHPTEEEKVLGVYDRLRIEIPTLRLILVPRHPDRADEVCELVQKGGWRCARISEVERPFPGQRKGQGQWHEPVLVVDQVGWLGRLYGYAQVAFVGGSLVPHGGQNMLEPAAWSIPAIFGPHTFNFKEASQQMLDADGGVMVEDEETLYQETLFLFQSPDKRQEMGARAHKVVADNAGALKRTMDAIEGTIEGYPLT